MLFRSQTVVEKTTTQTSEVTSQPISSPVIEVDSSEEFIPNVGDNDLEVNSKVTSTTVVNKDFAEAAASLKED